jgi:hypothetical protein
MQISHSGPDPESIFSPHRHPGLDPGSIFSPDRHPGLDPGSIFSLDRKNGPRVKPGATGACRLWAALLSLKRHRHPGFRDTQQNQILR